MQDSYLPRIVDDELRRRLGAAGAIVVEGPRACGKTATARRAANSEVLLDVDESARRAATVAPALVLDGPTPRLLDEWQVEPSLWNHVRRAIDDRGLPGQFILTGSSVPADDITRHTGAGRISRLRMRMRPMSLFESGHSAGTVSLQALLKGEPAHAADPGLTLQDITGRIVAGGWPGWRTHPLPDAARAVRDYLDEIQRTDITRVDGTSRDPERVARVVRALARNVATYVTSSTLAADAGGTDGALARDTVSSYLTALERLMIIEDQPSWAPRLRSKSILRGSPKRHFVDPSLAVAALHGSPERLLADLRLLGFLFESLVVRDLRIYAQANDARILQYRDNTGLEIDAIIEIADGRWAAIEVKLGGALVDDGAASLLRFRDRVDTSTSGPPAALGVVVATGYAYRRPDGVDVIPIGTLGP